MDRKIHIISNRLPYSIKQSKGKITLKPSVGGLATGMANIYRDFGGKWIGWNGLAYDKIDKSKMRSIDTLFKKEECVPVHLNKKEIHYFYEGFSNRAIWPLFHYFNQLADFNLKDWNAYVAVNQKFADHAIKLIGDTDIVWVHDYQLLLVPEMIKRKKPKCLVGFFLHIPFPSFEIFRVLPWRKELLKGMLGADQIGFHTYDYQRHFCSCVRRILGYDVSFNQIMLEKKIVFVDAFPMGIDFEKFTKASKGFSQKEKEEKTMFRKELDKFHLKDTSQKLILSIDRLDYTKGIPQRLEAFKRFLEKYPQYQGIVSLVMVAVPSRSNVDHYQILKTKVDALVGEINGKYGKINYQPIRYFYRSLPFESLISLYCSCDIALITPIRDGMNLVAKEYVASRQDNTGTLILSEMAGVVKEMGEALIIVPTDQEQFADTIFQALTMPIIEQKERILTIKNRLKRYDVYKWANEFVESLQKTETFQKEFNAKCLNISTIRGINNLYRKAKSRAFFLDYDGTLCPFFKNPQEAIPSKELKVMLTQLASNPKNNVTIISGRDKETLIEWFKDIPVNLICEHGVCYKPYQEPCKDFVFVSNDWMPNILPIMERYVDRTPGSFIEKKNYSLVWHYRKAEVEQSELRANELKEALNSLIANHNLELLEGHKVIEVKCAGINKGAAIKHVLSKKKIDLIIAIGDDWTDEYMFKVLRPNDISIKVGFANTYANYRIESVKGVLRLLQYCNKKK